MFRSIQMFIEPSPHEKLFSTMKQEHDDPGERCTLEFQVARQHFTTSTSCDANDVSWRCI